MAETDLHISERLRNLLPPLTPDERKQLKANIEADGRVREPLLFWNHGDRNIVVDGMHRWEIVRWTDIPYETQEMNFASYEDVEIWILNHQLGRRNLLKPSDIRKVIGELYNRTKRQDKGHGDQKSGYQNDTPILTAAQEVAEKAGISPATVKRDGARVDIEAKLTKAANAIADKATDAEVKALAKLDSSDQDQVARSIRTGQAKTVKEALKGIKPSGGSTKPPKATPPNKNSRSSWYKKWNTAIGPLCRLVDKIAEELGESKCDSQNTVQDHLNVATEEMMDWLGVKR
jgi:hypothetical protein